MDLLKRSLQFLLISLFTVLVLVVLWQVFTRYVLGSPATFTEELSRFLLMWLGLLGGAYVFIEKKHIAIDLLAQRLSLGFRFLVWKVSSGLFALILLFGGFSLVKNAFSLEQTAPALGLSMGIVYLCVPLSGLCILLTVLFSKEDSWN